MDPCAGRLRPRHQDCRPEEAETGRRRSGTRQSDEDAQRQTQRTQGRTYVAFYRFLFTALAIPTEQCRKYTKLYF